LTEDGPHEDRTLADAAEGTAHEGIDPMGPPPEYLEPVDDMVSINVEGRFPEIRRLKVIGTLLFALAGTMAVIPSFFLIEDPEMGPRTLLALGLAVAGITVGVAGMWSPSLRTPSMWGAPIILVAAAGAGSLGASLDTISPLEMLMAFLFAVCWLLALEHLHAVGRFVELGAYVTRQRLTTFSLRGVVNHFQIYGVGLVVIISAVTAVVVVGVPWVFSKGSSGTFARSVELNSVFGIALAAAVVFTLSAMILVFVRSVMPQRVDVERVAYSRDRMEDMLRSSHMMETEDEGSR
jgi:hypothetical protein